MRKVLRYLDKCFGVSEFLSHERKLSSARKRYRRMKRAVRIAISRHKADGRRYYVIYDWEGKYHAFNNSEIGFLKRARILSKNVTIKDLLMEAAIYVDATNIKSVEQRYKKNEL